MNFSKTLIHKAIISLTILSVCACSTTSRMNIVQPGDTVSITSKADNGNNKIFGLSNSNAIMDDAKTGGYSGATAGALYGLFCGPFVVICVPIGAAIGAAGGAVVGATVGAATGDTDKGEELFTKMNNYLTVNNPQDEFLTSVTALAEQKYQVSALSDKEISISLEQLTFNTNSDGRIILALSATVTVNYLDKLGRQKSNTNDYDYESSPQFLDTWLDGSDDFYQSKLANAYSTLAEHIIRTL